MALLTTFGHGRLDREALGALVAEAGIEEVVDVRRFPGSRANPAAARGAVPALCEELGVAYRWDERLGGRRRLDAAQEAASPDTWWQVAQFRAYAGWTRSDDFRAATDDLLVDVAARRTAIMCSEAVWWRCHRRIVADVVVLGRGLAVEHLMHDGRRVPHPVSAGARRQADGDLVWDGPA